jgi:GTP-binding protein
MREANKDATVVLKAARRMSLEMALEYIASDEAVEITPTSIRMRKIILSEAERRRQSRNERARAAGAAT